MVARASERDRQAEPIEPGQHVVEPGRVLEREHPREQVLVGVEVVERRLDAREVRAVLPERDQRLLQLIRLRPVLGVVDHDVLASREREPDVAGLRLRLRCRVGDDEETNEIGRRGRLGRGERLRIVLLEEEQDLELLPWVVERAEVAHQRADHVRLPVRRYEHRVVRQVAVDQCCDLLVGDRLGVLDGEAQHADEQLEADEHGERERHHRENGRQRDPRREHRGGREHDGGPDECPDLAPVEDARGRLVGMPEREARDSMLDQVLTPGGPQRPSDVPVGRHDLLDLLETRHRPHRCRDLLARPPRHRDQHLPSSLSAVLDADGHPTLPCELMRVEAMREALVDLLHVGDGHVPQLAERLVQRAPGDQAGGEQHLAERLADPPVPLQCGLELLWREQPTSDEQLTQAVGDSRGLRARGRDR